MKRGLFAATGAVLGRPFGPLGGRFHDGHDFTVPYRPEVTMLRATPRPFLHSDIRLHFKKLRNGRNTLHAIPRDVGELPRNYIIKILYFNQPCRLGDLWELCKTRDDVPLDSQKHLRLVLKVARMQNWVYCEKNQSNNEWYFYVHRRRQAEVQQMVLTDNEQQKEMEVSAAAERQARKEEANAEHEEAVDVAIRELQIQLAEQISRIKEFNPTFVDGLPCVDGDGSVNFTWHTDAPQLEGGVDRPQELPS